MDGYQVARRIREEPHGRGMLLLALTGYGSPGDAQHVRRSTGSTITWSSRSTRITSRA